MKVLEKCERDILNIAFSIRINVVKESNVCFLSNFVINGTL